MCSLLGNLICMTRARKALVNKVDAKLQATFIFFFTEYIVKIYHTAQNLNNSKSIHYTPIGSLDSCSRKDIFLSNVVLSHERIR